MWILGKKIVKENPNVDELINIVSEHETEIFELSLSPESEEGALTITGYVAKKLLKRSDCNDCKENMVGDENDDVPEYFQLLSRGGLTIPSVSMAIDYCYSWLWLCWRDLQLV